MNKGMKKIALSKKKKVEINSSKPKIRALMTNLALFSILIEKELIFFNKDCKRLRMQVLYL